MELQERSRSILPISAVILIMGVGGYLLYEQPFVSLRPAQEATYRRQMPGLEDVETRLWEDPFKAVAFEREPAGSASALTADLAVVEGGAIACSLGPGPGGRDPPASRRLRIPIADGRRGAGSPGRHGGDAGHGSGRAVRGARGEAPQDSRGGGLRSRGGGLRADGRRGDRLRPVLVLSVRYRSERRELDVQYDGRPLRMVRARRSRAPAGRPMAGRSVVPSPGCWPGPSRGLRRHRGVCWASSRSSRPGPPPRRACSSPEPR